jgi:PAS domain S-box-containing protein
VEAEDDVEPGEAVSAPRPEQIGAIESWLPLAFDAVPDAMLIIDAADRIALLNRAADQLFGYPHGELIGQSVERLIPDWTRRRDRLRDRTDGAIAPRARTLTAGPHLVGRARTGGELALAIELSPFDTPDGARTLISIVDLTARLAIAQLRRHMAAVVESTEDAIICTNLDGTILSFNPGAEHLLGYASEEIVGQSFTRLVPDDHQREGAEILDQIARGERISQLETVRRRKDGARVDVSLTISPIRDHTGAVIGGSRIMRDITAHKRAQDLFRLVVESAPNAILVVDAQHVITLVNRNTEQLFGYSRDEMIGQSVALLVPVPFRKQHAVHAEAYRARPITRAMGGGRELIGRRKDGTEVAIEIGLNPLQTSDGLFTLASIIDITERKRVADELRRSNAELEQFAYVASHDLQEPLRMVASYTELLGQRYRGKLDDKADKYIFYAVDGAKRMQRLVSDLLAYSRVGSQGKRLVPVDAEAVVHSVVHMLGAAVRDASATIEVSPLPAVLADEGQLRQLFQNLIGNALKFRASADPVIGIRAARDGERWVFCVEDNGIGIDMQYAERIFQMFQRLHERNKYEGSGIGLAIVKRIVERHGGAIWLESKPGLGTSFFFSLPAVGGKAPA